MNRSTKSGRIVAASSKQNRASRNRRDRAAAPVLEALEQRALMSVIPVTTVADAGPGSLRDALALAQDGDTIDASGVTGTITLTSGPLEIAADLTITGPGAQQLSISGQGASQVIMVDADETGSISGVTITAGGGSAQGGAISSNGNLILVNVAVTNSSASADGGAIYVQGGSLTIQNSTLSGNTVDDTGAGPGSDNAGGAIFIASGSATLINCTISGNVVSGPPAGGPNNGGGGGIYVAAGSLSLMSDTIAGNTVSNSGPPGHADDGGGVALAAGATLVIENTIVANNSAHAAADISSTGGITDNGGNLFGTAVNGIVNGASGSLFGVDPLLAPLSNNGGPTQTMAMSARSPARDAGSIANSPPTTDQRGDGRSGLPDIGAYEYQDSAPAFTSTPTTTATATQAYTYAITTADSDGDNVTITASSLPSWLTLSNPGNGSATLSGTPGAGDVGSASISLTVSDGILSTTQNFSITVSPAPVLPPTLTAINTFISGTENQAYTITYAALLTESNASDPNGLAISFLITSVDSGTLTLNGSAVVAGVSTLASGGSVVWTPAANASGTLGAFSVEATDGAATSAAPVAVKVQVAAVSPSPVAVDDSFSTVAGSAVNGNVLNNDSSPSGNPLFALVQSQPTHGSLSLALDGDFTYTPAAGFSGADSFTYLASDGLHTSNVATVSISVSATVQPGEFDFAAGSETVLSTAGSTTLTVNRINNTSGAVTVDYAIAGGTAVSGADYVLSNGTLQFAAGQSSATITVQIPSTAATNGDVTLILSLSNPTGGTTVGPAASTTLTIQHVTPEVPPVAVTDSFTTVQGTAISGNVLTNDSSPMGKPITAVLQHNVSHGSLLLNADGSFTYTPNASFVGTDHFTYTDSDGDATGNVVSVSIAVTAATVTPPPVATAGAFGFDQTAQNVGNLDGTLTVTVDRTGGSKGLATIDYAATGGTATAGVDYTVAAGTLTFADGQTSATFAIQIAGVGAGQADKTIVLTLSNPTGGASVGSASTDTVTITHVSDTPPVVGDIAVTRAPGAASVINLLSKVKNAKVIGPSLTISIISNPTYGSVSVLPNSVPGTFNVLYTPTPSFSVNDSFQYQVSDGKGAVVTATVNITVFGAGLDVNPLNTKQNDLVVVGSPRNDKIVFFSANRGTGVMEDGKLKGFFNNVSGRLVAYGLAGNDLIQDVKVARACYFWGGDGNDRLIGGGSTNDVLIGGNGNDQLRAGNGGRNILLGGAGSDSLIGSQYQDILVGDPTSYDVDNPATRLQINDLRNELMLTVPSAPVRWAAIMSDKGVGKTGAAFNSSTVIDDGAADVLAGQGSLNWLVGSFGDAGKKHDRVQGYNAANDLETNL